MLWLSLNYEILKSKIFEIGLQINSDNWKLISDVTEDLMKANFKKVKYPYDTLSVVKSGWINIQYYDYLLKIL